MLGRRDRAAGAGVEVTWVVMEVGNRVVRVGHFGGAFGRLLVASIML